MIFLYILPTLFHYVFMVKCSYEQKPFRREVMRTYGADVTPSPSLTTEAVSYTHLDVYKRQGTVPIHLKMTLTTKEAAEYSNIGINKIDSRLRSPNCPFVLFVGTKKLVKRKEFEQFISEKLVI